MIIYIAGAMSSKENTDRNPSQVVCDYIQNCHKMIATAREVMRKGHTPFVPALDLLIGLVGGDLEEKDYRAMSLEFLARCDAMLVISGSWGVEQELKFPYGPKTVYYRIEDIPVEPLVEGY